MKPFSYYNTRTIEYPNKGQFGKVFVYRAGKVVYEGDLATWPLHEDKYADGYTIEKAYDREAWLERRAAYDAEGQRLRDEFKADLLEEHGMTGHPKAEKAFELAREFGEGDFHKTSIYFYDLVDLIKD